MPWYSSVVGAPCQNIEKFVYHILLLSNGVRLMCGVRLMVNKTNHFNTEFVLKTPPTVVYISFHVYLTETGLTLVVIFV